MKECLLSILFVCCIVLFGCSAQVAPDSYHPQPIDTVPSSPVEEVQQDAVQLNNLSAPLIQSCGDGICNGTENCDRCLKDCGCKSGAMCYQGRCKVPECTNTSECNDADTCTVDSCEYSGHPNAFCLHDAITECKNNDGCCPQRCNAETDSDCKAVCGNHVCEVGESSHSCEKDCASKNDTV